MNDKLLVVAASLEKKADASKAKALADTDAALAASDNTKLLLATMEGHRATIYREVAASLREAADA